MPKRLSFSCLFSCTVLIFPSSYGVVCRVDGTEIKGNTDATKFSSIIVCYATALMQRLLRPKLTLFFQCDTAFTRK